VRPIREPADAESAVLAESADFWRMIRERRQEQAIGWEEAKKGLQLD
jgi:hypothetical protein